MTLSIVTGIEMVSVFTYIIVSLSSLRIQGIVRVISLPVSLVVMLISWVIIFGYSFRIYYMLKKSRKVFFFQFKVS